VNSSPVGKVIGISAVSVIMELQVPSNKRSPIRVIDFVLILFLDTKSESKNESEELESRRVGRDNDFRMVRQMVKESGSKRADTLCYICNTVSDSDGFRTGFQQRAQPLSTFHFLSISNILPCSLTVAYSQPSVIAPIPAYCNRGFCRGTPS
jgi:hypothetical protein